MHESQKHTVMQLSNVTLTNWNPVDAWDMANREELVIHLNQLEKRLLPFRLLLLLLFEALGVDIVTSITYATFAD